MDWTYLQETCVSACICEQAGPPGWPYWGLASRLPTTSHAEFGFGCPAQMSAMSKPATATCSGALLPCCISGRKPISLDIPVAHFQHKRYAEEDSRAHPQVLHDGTCLR